MNQKCSDCFRSINIDEELGYCPHFLSDDGSNCTAFKLKNPNVTDAQREARKEVYEILTKDMTEEELKELKRGAEEVRKELGWDN